MKTRRISKKNPNLFLRKMTEHIPVLLNEAIEYLNIKPSGTYVDLTLGRAGHSSEILKKLTDGGRLIGIDKDEVAINESTSTLSKIGNNFVVVRNDFRNFKEELHRLGIYSVDGILMDLGVSSPQFDCAERGFSYRESAKLDMRMDSRQSLTAYDVVNTYSAQDLARVFREYGEDKYAYQIAKRIVKVRENGPIVTTDELVSLIKSVKPAKELAKKGHPAKQIFQALRIEVNDELGALRAAIKDALEILSIGGRLVIISFQSLEDRIVKNAFQEVAKKEGSRKNVWSLPSQEEETNFKLVNNKVILPSEEEMNINPRSKSAKMRVIEKIR